MRAEKNSTVYDPVLCWNLVVGMSLLFHLFVLTCPCMFEYFSNSLEITPVASIPLFLTGDSFTG